MPKILSFICQKGGTGKSTMTKLTAAYFNDRKASCVVLDADFPQYSIFNQRQQDLKNLSANGNNLPTAEELEKSGVSPYPIYPSNMETTALRLTSLKSSNEIKMVLVDLPGTLNVEGISSVIKHLDLVIVPCELEAMGIRAAMDTLSLLEERFPALRVGFLWSRLDRNHSETTREEIEVMIKKNFPSVEFFKFMAFKSRVYRDADTLHPATESLQEFVSEMINRLKVSGAPSSLNTAGLSAASSSSITTAANEA